MLLENVLQSQCDPQVLGGSVPLESCIRMLISAKKRDEHLMIYITSLISLDHHLVTLQQDL